MTLRQAVIQAHVETGAPQLLMDKIVKLVDHLFPTPTTENQIPPGREREVVELIKKNKLEEAYAVTIAQMAKN